MGQLRHQFGTPQPDGKRRLYDHDMLREDLSGRFDYLFEPLDVDESAGNGDDAAPRRSNSPPTRTECRDR